MAPRSGARLATSDALAVPLVEVPLADDVDEAVEEAEGAATAATLDFDAFVAVAAVEEEAVPAAEEVAVPS